MSTARQTPAVKLTASFVIDARNAKNAIPEARKSEIARSLVQIAWSRVSSVAATAIPDPQSSAIDSASNARVRSR